VTLAPIQRLQQIMLFTKNVQRNKNLVENIATKYAVQLELSQNGTHLNHPEHRAELNKECLKMTAVDNARISWF